MPGAGCCPKSTTTEAGCPLINVRDNPKSLVGCPPHRAVGALPVIPPPGLILVTVAGGIYPAESG